MPFRTSLMVYASILCAVAVASEFLRIRAGDAALKAHQSRWDCLVRESNKVPSCLAAAALGPTDADYCDKAAVACKALGLDTEVSQADERMLVWDRLARVLRLVVLVVVVASLLWFWLVRPIQRSLRPAESR